MNVGMNLPPISLELSTVDLMLAARQNAPGKPRFRSEVRTRSDQLPSGLTAIIAHSCVRSSPRNREYRDMTQRPSRLKKKMAGTQLFGPRRYSLSMEHRTIRLRSRIARTRGLRNHLRRTIRSRFAMRTVPQTN